MGIEEFENRIICGDNVEVMGKMPDECIDMSCQSPPYSSLRDYHGYVFDFEKVAQQLWRVTKPGGVVVWVVADETVRGGKTGESLRQALYFQQVGFLIYDYLLYHKTGNSFPSNARYTQCFEFMFVFSKGKPKTVNLICDIPKKWLGSFGQTTQRQRNGSLRKSSASNCGEGRHGRAKDVEYGFRARDTIWRITNGYGFAHPDPDLAKQHSATFPLAIPRDHIITWTNMGDVVLDSMNGSGTTCMAAKGLRRKYVGIDVSNEYCELATKRLEGIQEGEYLEKKI